MIGKINKIIGLVAAFAAIGCVKASHAPPKPPETLTHNIRNRLVFQAVGDLNFSGKARALLEERGYDSAFSGTRRLLSQGDVNFANLESPITDRGEAFEKTFTYRMAPESVAALQKAGLNVVSLANNHTLDFGSEGIEQTIELLDKAGIHHAGAGKNLQEARTPAIFQSRDLRVGVLAYSLTHPEEFYATATSPGTAFGHVTHVQDDIKKLRPQVDLLVVSFHWGAELHTETKPYQSEIAHAAIDAGADMVVGHHPHVVQGVERYKNGVVFYSLGNYAFGSYSNHVTWGLFSRTTWGREEGAKRLTLLEVELIPLNINNFQVDFCPVPLTGESADKALKELQTLSAPFGAKLDRFLDQARLKLNPP